MASWFRPSRRIVCLFAWGLATVLAVSPAGAEIRTSGEVDPIPPADGGTGIAAFTVGIESTGNVTINQGTILESTGETVLGETETGIGTVVLNGLGTSWTTQNLTVGELGAGFMALSGQSEVIVERFVYIGKDVGSQANVSISGLGTVWDSQNTMFIGDRGYGQVNVVDGGTLLSKNTVDLGNNVTGEARVVVQGNLSTGVLSRWINKGIVNVGDEGIGYLFVRSYGRVTNTGASSSIGAQEGSRGFAEVTGASALWDTQALEVGKRGYGSLRILDGGRVNSTRATQVGTSRDSRGEVEISGLGSLWKVLSLTTGSGEAQIHLNDNGLLKVDTNTTIGRLGRLTLQGGRLESTDMFNNGLVEGSGTILVPLLTNQSTGRIYTQEDHNLVIRGGIANAGLIDMAGGELETLAAVTNTSDIDLRHSIIRFGGTGLDNQSGGQLSITAGTVDVFGRVNNRTGADIVVARDAVAIFHDSVTTTGTITIRTGGDLLMLENLAFVPPPPPAGAPISVASVLEMSLNPTSSSAIRVSGTADLAGQLELNLDNSYVPQLGDSFELLSALGGISGTFDSLQAPTLAAGLTWDLQYDASSVVVDVIPSLPGDYNFNGLLDTLDFNVWRDSLGQTGVGLLADGNRDQLVDEADYHLWRDQFMSAAGGLLQAVPEPTTSLGSLLAVCLLARRRRVQN